jgi:pyruvate/2-oxoglutarate dehydrogenase complex dihydrolipoamide acyltransferase (E2) component
MDLFMPKLGMEMTEGILSRWFIEDGTTVAKGEPIYEVETEKVESEIESPASGTLRHLAEPGITYQVGDLLGRLDP